MKKVSVLQASVFIGMKSRLIGAELAEKLMRVCSEPVISIHVNQPVGVMLSGSFKFHGGWYATAPDLQTATDFVNAMDGSMTSKDGWDLAMGVEASKNDGSD